MKEFLDRLASSEPTPGGGGASALAGAVAAALGEMVANVTKNSKKGAEFFDELSECADHLSATRERLVALIGEDAAAFLPLSRAYKIPKTDPGRADAMEKALKAACEPPMAIMEQCSDALSVIERLGDIGSASIISDAGCGAILAGAAIRAAALNVFINVRSMKDRALAVKLEKRALDLLDDADSADDIYDMVLMNVQGT